MKIVLATGIYPPEIGGPATYARNLAEKLKERGGEVTVIAYGSESGIQNSENRKWQVVWISRRGGPIARWNRYAKALQEHAKDADIVYAFSSVSCGIPIVLARLKKPKEILRLGGDFLWERYTDIGGKRSLRSFYMVYPGMKQMMRLLLRRFHFIVFSTVFQERLCEFLHPRLPPHRVIENAIPEGRPQLHQKHDPFRLLFLGRFVRFKNLSSLIRAVSLLPYVHLTLAGDGPARKNIQTLVAKLGLQGRVKILEIVAGPEKETLLAEHDLLVLPSFTELSPHAAIEARVAGLPVLLTEEMGLSPALNEGMLIKTLRTSEDITRAVMEAEQKYGEIAQGAARPLSQGRPWDALVEETMELFRSIVSEQTKC
ncbi:glycosyltransferase family 4 protein [Candidatus Peregrinibacteria bacterium]|nr:glycosyltransferase family 4 protein [Candidatus Peregrinibacteria bacterium]MBI3816622.1 glycosyltransferase family 4 protein [Candidatus Peregrinibacteria bacterium]